MVCILSRCSAWCTAFYWQIPKGVLDLYPLQFEQPFAGLEIRTLCLRLLWSRACTTHYHTHVSASTETHHPTPTGLSSSTWSDIIVHQRTHSSSCYITFPLDANVGISLHALLMLPLSSNAQDTAAKSRRFGLTTTARHRASYRRHYFCCQQGEHQTV